MFRASIALIIAATLLFLIGLAFVFNTSAAEIIDRSLDADIHASLFKQIVCGVFGVGIGICLYKIGYERLLRWSVPLVIIVSVLLAALFVPGLARTINGARRWFSIFGLSFQPSECAKLLIPAVFIHWHGANREAISFRSFLKILLWLAVPLILILLEPDNGTTAIIIVTMAALFFLARIPWRYWALPLACLIGVGATAAFQMPHVRDRIRIYLHPELDLRGKGHQPHQAKIAAGSGGLFGRGVGESIQKLNYLPEARSDYIAAIYAEETGFLGVTVLIGLYTIFGFAGMSIAFQAADRGAFLFASIITFLIAVQAFLNLGIVSGILPSKGMTLPFFSQGGWSLMMNLASVFVLLDIARKRKSAIAA